MPDETREKLKEVFAEALQLHPSDRHKFVAEKCADEETLRVEVESLLSSFDEVGSFLEEPAVTEVADVIVDLEDVKWFGHYETIKQIGSGGMGKVYLARDHKLDRLVAIKILSERFARHESNLQRLVREAKAASALNHPNILVIHEIGESDETKFIVSEYVEGKNLREFSKERSLLPSEIFDIAIQIANALSAAHSAQIIHRDIKPENIMIRPDGYVKVLDFGLAKTIASDVKPQNETAQGVILGTVQYMSPEQAKGENLDERTDIFSFGVLLYEMVAGKTPFAADSMSETAANLLDKEAPVLQNIPEGLWRVIAKTLRKKRDERYQTTTALLGDLKQLRESASFSQLSEGKTKNLEAATGGTKHETAKYGFFEQIGVYQKLAAVFLIVLAAFGIWYFSVRSANAKPVESVAVMPFINESGDQEVEYLSDGMTDALINSLSQIPETNVKGHTSVFRYKGKDYAVDKIGKELDVQAVLSGRITKYGDELTLSLSLEDVKTGNQIWGGQFNKKLDNLISLQSEVARDVTNMLQVKLSGKDERLLAKKYTANSDAYRLYLQGRYHWNKRTAVDMQKALDYFQQAVALDPKFALAYTGIADTYALISNYGDAPPPLETKPKAKEFALKALALDEELAEAHAALGLILTEFDYNFAEAEIHYRRAIELNPNYSSVRQFYGELLSHLGRFDESVGQFEQALTIDPLSPGISRVYAGTLYQAGRYDQSLSQLRKTLEINPNFAAAYATMSVVYNLKGEFVEGNETYAKFQELSDLPERAALVRNSFARGGRREVLRNLTKEPQPTVLTSYIDATFLAELGAKDRAFAKLNESLAKREYQMVLLKNDPRLDPLRDDARFQDLLYRVGFPK